MRRDRRSVATGAEVAGGGPAGLTAASTKTPKRELPKRELPKNYPRRGRPKTRTTTRGSRARARVTHGRLRSADTPRTNPRLHPTALSRCSRDATDTSGDVERDRRTARAGHRMRPRGPKSARNIHLREAARRARAESKMRPLRPHRSSPARTVLPLDGSRGVESPGIESMGHAVRSHTGQTTLTGTHPAEATHASEGTRKISLPRRKVNQARWLRHGGSGGRPSTSPRSAKSEACSIPPSRQEMEPPPRSTRSFTPTGRPMRSARLPRS